MHLWYTLFQHPFLINGAPKIAHIFCSRVKAPHHGRGRDRNDTGYAFQYTLKGEGVVKIREQEYKIKPGMAFFWRVNDPEIEYFVDPENTGSWEFVFCDIEEKYFSTLAEGMIEQYSQIYHIDINDTFIQQMLAYQKYSEQQVNLSFAENIQLVNDLLICISTSNQKSKSKSGHQLVDAALDLISQSDLKVLNVSYLAQKLSVSREHLTRLFKKHLNSSPHPLINTKRIQTAQNLLRSTSLEVQEIAFQCGISREQFSTWFRQNIGESPKEFRHKIPVAKK